MSGEDFQVSGQNAAAPFTLKLHRGAGMILVAMSWKDDEPPRDFVGFTIEYEEPGGDEFFALNNRINFPGPGGEVNPERLPTSLSPIQKFRWVHFPRNADLPGEFVYRVLPVFMTTRATKGTICLGSLPSTCPTPPSTRTRGTRRFLSGALTAWGQADVAPARIKTIQCMPRPKTTPCGPARVNFRVVPCVIPDSVPSAIDRNPTKRRYLVPSPISRKDALELGTAAGAEMGRPVLVLASMTLALLVVSGVG